MSAEHTPGPWTAKIYDRTISVEVGSPKKSKITVVGWSGFDSSDPPFRRQVANARLIAAAPDLLAALEAVSSNPHLDLGSLVYKVRDSEGEGWDGPAVTQWSNAVQAVKAAIAKAKGDQP